MNITARRTVTTLAGVALAASAFAGTGSAAVAAKPVKAPTPITVIGTGSGTAGGSASLSVDYTVPVASAAVTSVTCTLDGVQQTYCGDIVGASSKATYYWGYVVYNEVEHVDHTFSVTVTTKKTTYAGSVTWRWEY